jgi:hypothetical protein
MRIGTVVRLVSITRERRDCNDFTDNDLCTKDAYYDDYTVYVRFPHCDGYAGLVVSLRLCDLAVL